MNLKNCERCGKVLNGFTFSFGHDEIFGQVLNLVCADCVGNVLYEYKALADDRASIMKEIQELRKELLIARFEGAP